MQNHIVVTTTGVKRAAQSGFVAISATLILSVVVLAIVTTVSLLSINELQASYGLSQGEDTLVFVEGCVEEYLYRIRANSAYIPVNITLPGGKICVPSITSGNPNWDLTVGELNADYDRRIRVVFTRNAAGISLTSWQEI